VQFVGDATCAQCHPGQAETFSHHPMGRSLAPIADPVSREAYGSASHNPFTAQRIHYQVDKTGSRVVHREAFVDASGTTLASTEAEVHYRLGSGTRGYTYLIERDGFVFESPISWYSQKKIWDLSPGYENHNQHFTRAIGTDCLFCHSNRIEPVPHAINRFTPPLFRGHAIGCERCHGPGELHVREAAVDTREGFDPTIVNPRHLPPALREAVCQQCHLQGEARIVRSGRELLDYRPGLPLHLYLSVFLRAPEMSDSLKAVGQVEQMYLSRCFRQSNGKLGCTSCHDPHQVPAAEDRATFFRNRCLNCHQPNSCTAPPVSRQKKGDSCYACHMPHHDSEIPHTSSTDHRIVRRPDRPPVVAGVFPPALPGLDFVSYFFADGAATSDRDYVRDVGIALLHMGRDSDHMNADMGAMVEPMLQAAVKRRPDDLAAWESYGWSLVIQNRFVDALRAFEMGLERAPDAEALLAAAAHSADRSGRLADALALARRAVAADPRNVDYEFHLAVLLLKNQEWAGAQEASQAALRLNPFHARARMLLASLYNHLGETAKSREEFARLKALNPDEAEKLAKWFSQELPDTVK
jgi:Flp pilus assembly protein TadD